MSYEYAKASAVNHKEYDDQGDYDIESDDVKKLDYMNILNCFNESSMLRVGGPSAGRGGRRACRVGGASGRRRSWRRGP